MTTLTHEEQVTLASRQPVILRAQREGCAYVRVPPDVFRLLVRISAAEVERQQSRKVA